MKADDAALRLKVRQVAKRLAHAAALAMLAASSAEPERGAQYLTDTVEDLAADIRSLRAFPR